jgi:hypothetical protein
MPALSSALIVAVHCTQPGLEYTISGSSFMAVLPFNLIAFRQKPNHSVVVAEARERDAANQITTAGYSFDGAGNMTVDPAGTYTYDGAQQMTGVTSGGGSFSYKYAGTSQVEVLQQQTASATYKIVYGRTNQPGMPVIEQAHVGSVTAYVENDPTTGQPLMLRTSTGAVSLYVYDGTGNPTAILRDVTGAGYVYKYDPYGLPTLDYTSGGSGTQQNPFLFKGGIQDRATGWVHFGQPLVQARSPAVDPTRQAKVRVR